MTRARDLASGLAGVRPFAMAAGINSCGANASVTITYPAGRFTQTPMLSTSAVDVGTYTVNELVLGRTGTTSFLAYSYSSNCNISWVAIQMTSGAANG